MRGSDRPRGELGAANFRASLSRLVTARPVESVRVYCQGLLAGLSQQDVQTLDCALQPGDRPGPAVSSPDWILSSMQRKPPRISETFVRSNLSGLAALITGATSPGRSGSLSSWKEGEESANGAAILIRPDQLGAEGLDQDVKMQQRRSVQDPRQPHELLLGFIAAVNPVERTIAPSFELFQALKPSRLNSLSASSCCWASSLTSSAINSQ